MREPGLKPKPNHGGKTALRRGLIKRESPKPPIRDGKPSPSGIRDPKPEDILFGQS
jgi:hypothetical protein